MSAQHVRALIEEIHGPRVSIRGLCLNADPPLDPNRLAYYLKPSTDVENMPKSDTMREIARVVGCPLWRVVVAFTRDVGLPAEGVVIEDPRLAELVLDLWPKLNSDQQEAVLRVAEALSRSS